MKKVKALLALSALVAIVTVSSVAFASQTGDVTVETEIRGGASLTVICWNDNATWEWSGTSVYLYQPGSRANDIDPNPMNDPAHPDYTWGEVDYVTSEDTYANLGANPDSVLSIDNNNAFGYGDCKTIVSTGRDEWDITLEKRGGFMSGGNAIPDMQGFFENSFDFYLDNGNNYDPSEAEHGFYIAGIMDVEPPAPGQTALRDALQTDDGSATVEGAYPVYDPFAGEGPKAFDAMDCGPGSNEPCYHWLPVVISRMYSAQLLFAETTNLVDNEFFVTRFGVGVDNTTASGTYSLQAIYTLTI